MSFWDSIFGTANKPAPLSSHGATRLRGNGDFDFPVAGESHYQSALTAICGGKSDESAMHECDAVLRPDPNNRFDANAVAIEIDGQVVGYVSRQHGPSFRAGMADLGLAGKKVMCRALITGGWLRARDGDEGHYGVRLDIRYPFEIDEA